MSIGSNLRVEGDASDVSAQALGQPGVDLVFGVLVALDGLGEVLERSVDHLGVALEAGGAEQSFALAGGPQLNPVSTIQKGM